MSLREWAYDRAYNTSHERTAEPQRWLYPSIAHATWQLAIKQLISCFSFDPDNLLSPQRRAVNTPGRARIYNFRPAPAMARHTRPAHNLDSLCFARVQYKTAMSAIRRGG